MNVTSDYSLTLLKHWVKKLLGKYPFNCVGQIVPNLYIKMIESQISLFTHRVGKLRAHICPHVGLFCHRNRMLGEISVLYTIRWASIRLYLGDVYQRWATLNAKCA